MSHHLTGEVPSRTELMSKSCKARTMRRDQIFPVHPRGNASQGRKLFCFHHQHMHQLCTTTHPQSEEEAAGSATVEQKRSWGTGRNSLLAVQIITWSIQRNTCKKIPSCVFVQATCLFFRLQEIRWDSYFFRQQYFSYCYFYFHEWTIGNEESVIIKTIKWLCYESVLFWIALGHTALPRRAAEGISAF